VKVEVFNHADGEVFAELVAGVRAYNAEFMGSESSMPLSVISRNERGQVIAGVSGRTIYKQFLIEVAWVAKDFRGSGLGRTLMERAEAEARARGCLAAQVDTLSFQAPDFYEKLGFEIVGKVTGIPGSPDRIFLAKHYRR